MTHAEQAAKTLRNQFIEARVERPEIKASEEDYIGDGLCGFVTVNDLTLYPVETPHGIGWGVDQAFVVPGCHTMPNGDPGYPDEVDFVTIVEATKTRKTLGDDVTLPNSLFLACVKIVCIIVEDRINDAANSE